jgi:hypothetical protein
VSAQDLGLLVLAGVGAGAVGSGAGLASLVSFPALLAFGLPPLTANVTNTVALTMSSLGSVASSQPELKGKGRLLARYCAAAVVGGAAGAVLLLSLPAESFEKVVPWLVALAAVSLLARPWLRRWMKERIHGEHRGVTVGLGIIAVYGGYFGAAAGVLMLALLAAAVDESFARVNAVKNTVLGAANATAAVIFLAVGPVDLAAAVPLGVGCLAGAAVAPPIVRRLPERPVRIVIGVSGLLLAVQLAVDAYR